MPAGQTSVIATETNLVAKVRGMTETRLLSTGPYPPRPWRRDSPE